MKILKFLLSSHTEEALDHATKQLRRVKDRIIELDMKVLRLTKENRVLKSAVTTIAARDGKISHDELVQLGVAHLLTFDADNAPVEIDEGPRAMLMASDNQQATNAKFRQIKRHFIQHRAAVQVLLDRLEKLSTSNAMGPEIHEIAAIRDELRTVMGKSI